MSTRVPTLDPEPPGTSSSVRTSRLRSWLDRLPAWTGADDSVAETQPSRLLPTVVVMCVGTLLVTLAYARGRTGHPGSASLYWLGEALLLLPPVFRVLAPRVRTSERLALLATLAGLQSFLAWAYSPDQFRNGDELQHVRTLSDILASGHLFTTNAALPVSSGFPGMEVATSALVRLAGLTPFAAGVLVVSVAHVLVPLFVFGLVRDLVGSPRLAAVAALVYFAAPHGAYYNTLFVYGAVALPFFVLCLWAALGSRRRTRSVLWVVPPFVVVTVTHPLTIGVTLAGLVLCVAVLALAREDRLTTLRLLGLSAGCAVGAAVWTSVAYSGTFGYLGRPILSVTRTVTHPGTTSGAPPAGTAATVRWEQLTTIGAAALLTLLVLAGLVAMWRSRLPRVATWWATAALAYPAALAVREVSPTNAEAVTRGITFLLVVAALPVAVALTWWWTPRARGRLRLLAVAATVVLLLGAITTGLPAWWQRVPHGFVYGGNESAVDPSVLAAGAWAVENVPGGSIVACDVDVCTVVTSRTRTIATTRGSQVFGASDPRLGTELGRYSVDYLFVDRRMTTAAPPNGLFFADETERPSFVPYPAALLAKFDTTFGVDRVYDNGDIQGYSVRRAWRG